MAAKILREQVEIVREVKNLKKNYWKDAAGRKTKEYFKRKLDKLEWNG